VPRAFLRTDAARRAAVSFVSAAAAGPLGVRLQRLPAARIRPLMVLVLAMASCIHSVPAGVERGIPPACRPLP